MSLAITILKFDRVILSKSVMKCHVLLQNLKEKKLPNILKNREKKRVTFSNK